MAKIINTAALVLFCLCNTLVFTHAQGQTNLDFRCTPYLQNMADSAMTVMWLMNKPCTSWVEYGETSSLGAKTVPSHVGLVDANLDIQKVRLTGLIPGKTYYYRTASKEILTYEPYKVVYGEVVYSPVHSFRLPSSTLESFSFLAFNDIHNKAEFVNGICSSEKNIDFVVLNGDIVADIMSENQIIEALLKPASAFFAADKPFVMVRGNHETRGPGARAWGKYFDFPGSDFFYTFNYGQTFFVALDTGEDKVDASNEYFGLADFDHYRSEEAKWLQSVITTPAFQKARFRIALSHFPINSLNPVTEHGISECNAKFAPLLNKGKIDLFLCGHTHHPEIVLPNTGKSHYPIFIGGTPLVDKNTTYTRVDVLPRELKVTMKKADGAVISSHEFERKGR